MCQFKSAIVLREPRNKGGFQLLMSPWTESHSELIQIHNLRDDGRLRFARVEFTPDSMATADKPETYKLLIDEEREPDWFDAEMKEAVADKMRDYIKSIIVTGDVALLIGGQFIVAGGAKIHSVKTCVINAMMGSAKVGSIYDSAKVGSIYGSAKVDYIYGSAKVGSISDSAKIKNDNRNTP